MEILFCIDRFDPARGGAERYLLDLGTALLRRGHGVTVAAFPEAAAPPRNGETGEGISFHALTPPPPSRVLREVSFARQGASLRRSGRFDRTVGFRHVLEVDRFQPHEGLFRDALEGDLRARARHPAAARLLFCRKLLSPKNLFFLYADRLLFRRCPGLPVAALSCAVAEAVRRRHARWDPAVTVIPNGVNRSRFHPGLREAHREGVVEELRLPRGEPVLLFVGHNFRLKGLAQALAAFRRFLRRKGEGVLLVAGRGKEAPYARWVRRHGMEGRVRFLGPRSDVPRLYGAADLLLHPTFYDPCSLVVLEAFGAGVPVVTTRFNGAAELMRDHREGRILPHPRDTKALARAIEEILDPALAPRFRDAAARLGEACDFGIHVERMESWILGKEDPEDVRYRTSRDML